MKKLTFIFLFFLSLSASANNFQEVQRIYSNQKFDEFIRVTQKPGVLESMPMDQSYQVALMFEALRRTNSKYDSQRMRDVNFIWYRQASAQGNPRAMYKVAQAYQDGIGTYQNPSLASQFFNKAKASGVV